MNTLNNPTKDWVINALNNLDLKFSDKGKDLVIKICPFCTGDTIDSTNQYKNTLNIDKGVFNCFRCSSKGTIKHFFNLVKTQDKATLEIDDSEKAGSTHYLKDKFDEGFDLSDEKSASAAAYLDNRNLYLPQTKNVRFHPSVPFTAEDEVGGKLKFNTGAIVSKIQDSKNNHIGSHFIHITEDGRKIPFSSPKKMQGKVGGGFILIEGCEDEIHVTEGLENAIAVFNVTSQKTYSALSCNGLKKFIPPKDVQVINIWGDRDKNGVGDRAARALAERLREQGKTVYLHMPPKILLRNKKSVDVLDELTRLGNLNSYLNNRIPYDPYQHDWPPPINEKSQIGLMKKLIDGIRKSTEADTNALILTFLTITGNILGRTCYVKVGALEFFPNLFLSIIGSTARGRKGTSLSNIREVIGKFFSQYFSDCVVSGLASGEGLIFQVRDEVKGKEKNKDGIEVEVIKDPGAVDKRCLNIEQEFQALLSAASRVGSTITAVLRNAWDGTILSTLSKNSPCKSTDHHVSLITHCTAEELESCFGYDNSVNGLGNRFLWGLSRRSRKLPIPPEIDWHFKNTFGAELSLAISNAKNISCFRLATEAEPHWIEITERFDDENLMRGLYGKMIGRGPVQILKMALIFAVLNNSKVVGIPEIEAAIEVWNYCEASAHYLFSGVQSNSTQRKIIRALENADNGLTKSDILDIFGRHKSAADVDEEMDELKKEGLVRVTSESTGGRNATRFYLL